MVITYLELEKGTTHLVLHGDADNLLRAGDGVTGGGDKSRDSVMRDDEDSRTEGSTSRSLTKQPASKRKRLRTQSYTISQFHVVIDLILAISIVLLYLSFLLCKSVLHLSGIIPGSQVAYGNTWLPMANYHGYLQKCIRKCR